MQSQEGRKREKFENCLQIVGTSVPEGWNGPAIKSVSAMQAKNIAVRRRGRRGEGSEQGKLIICARGEIDDAQAAALCVVNGLCRAAGLPVEVADEQGGRVDHEAVAHGKTAGEIIRCEYAHGVRIDQTDIIALFPRGGKAVGLMVVRNGAQQTDVMMRARG